ncbi:MAG: hypothetical protein R2873_00425 [Caldilineaceae bacterium]
MRRRRRLGVDVVEVVAGLEPEIAQVGAEQVLEEVCADGGEGVLAGGGASR